MIIKFSALIPALLFLIPAQFCTASTPDTTDTRELIVRQQMAVDRLLNGTEPTFTPEFIIADVASTRTIGKRRFDNFHGDISGRYLSAIAQLPHSQHPAVFEKLIHDIIGYQQADGRFGRPSLAFTTDEIGPEHMALLWGNGRLLVGLLDVYPHYPSDEILLPAVRLGDFLLNIIEVCSTPGMAERLKDLKANGYICFTQLTEGLAMLSECTGNPRYAEAARSIYKWLPERGHQHSHGYLSTLRGVMLTYGFLGNPDDLTFVEKHYADLVASSDYTPSGSVNEYFGTPADHKNSLRTEGCSDADFLGLSLQLWNATRKQEYLDRAERCLVNALAFNQFNTGDFGHHNLNGNQGYRLDEQDHRAWWCCTMHGLKFLSVASDNNDLLPLIASHNDPSNHLNQKLLTPAGEFIPLDSITTRTTGYLFNGPYLMGADGIAAASFLAEPSNGNIIHAKTMKIASPADLPALRKEAHLEFRYVHDGFPGQWTVRLRPIGDITFGARTAVRTLLTFEP